MEVLSVFVNYQGRYGNPVGIVIDEDKVLSYSTRLKKTLDSGFSEIVYIDSIKNREISIFSPTRQIPFAGHAAIGACKYISDLGSSMSGELISMSTRIEYKIENEIVWVEANLSDMPDWNFRELTKHEDVDMLSIDNTKGYEHCFVWSWLNEENGMVRARTFAPDWLIPEDEANGSGSLLLSNILKRDLTIYHGEGSIINAKYINQDTGVIGGRVIKKTN